MTSGARLQVKIWKTGQLSRHYIAEMLLNVTLNHNQPTNQQILIEDLMRNEFLKGFSTKTRRVEIVEY